MDPSRQKPPLLALLLALLALLLARPVQANADKIVFTAPVLAADSLPVPAPLSRLALALRALTDNHAAAALRMRTNLSRVFDPHDAGHPVAWFLLGDLTQGQRYELRVCWSALQPTSFTLDVFSPATVHDTPSLLQSLSGYATTNTNSHKQDQDQDQDQASPDALDASDVNDSPERTTDVPTSAMLLRVHARADYFSHHKALMSPPPPPVLVDLILDPYIYNILPRSLLPTAAYLVAVAVLACFLAKWIARSLISIAGSGTGREKKKQS